MDTKCFFNVFDDFTSVHILLMDTKCLFNIFADFKSVHLF